jgi:hypothetical protein
MGCRPDLEVLERLGDLAVQQAEFQRHVGRVLPGEPLRGPDIHERHAIRAAAGRRAGRRSEMLGV